MMAHKTRNLTNQRFCKVLILFKYCKSDRRRIKFPTTLRFENQQKKTPLSIKQKQAMFYSLLCFQLFVDLFVIAEGFSPNQLNHCKSIISTNLKYFGETIVKCQFFITNSNIVLFQYLSRLIDKNNLVSFSSGDWTRTSDLRVMSLNKTLILRYIWLIFT